MLESLNAYQFIMAAINLIILYIVLRKILFKPVTEFMEKRTKSIEDAIHDADSQRVEANLLKSLYDQKLRDAETEKRQILTAAETRGRDEEERIVAEAKKQADTLLAQAREDAEAEHQQMLREVRSEVASLALAAASRVMEANMDTESNRALVEQFLNEAGAA